MPQRSRPLHQIINTTDRSTVCGLCELADTFVSRLLGLLGRRALDPSAGMLIAPSSGIHTFGMRFPIDVVSLDHNLEVISLHPALGSWRVAGLSRKTRSILELPAGQISQSRIAVGDRLLLCLQ